MQEREDDEPFASLAEPDARKGLVAELHRLKTDIFMDMVEAGSMPLRPGVARLVGASFSLGQPWTQARDPSTFVRRWSAALWQTRPSSEHWQHE